jgi:hypothetical protein
VSGSDEIRVEITRNRADYLSAVWANFWQSGAWLWIAGGAVALGVAIGALSYSQGNPDAVPEGLHVTAVFAAVTIPAYALLLSLTAWRSWRQPGALEPVAYTFTRESIEVKTKVGASTTQWPVWSRAFENGRILVIRHRLNLMHFLPKRQIPAETLTRLKALLRIVLDGRVAFKSEPAP